MGRPATLRVDVNVDTKRAQQEIHGFAAGINKLAGPAAIAGAAVAAFGVKAVKSASEQRSAMGGLADVYGAAGAQMAAFAKTGAKALGMSTTDTANAATAMGAAMRGMGIDSATAAKQVTSVMPGLRDLASLYNVDMTTAVEGFQGALRGEYDQLQRVVPTVNAAAVEQEALAQTHKKSAKQLTATDKEAAIYSLTMKEAAKATGTWNRESKGGQSAQERLNATWQDAQAALGTALLPAMDLFVGALTAAAGLLGKNVGATQILLGVIGGLAAIIVTTSAAMKIHAAITGVVAVMQGRAAAQTALQTAALVAQRIALAVARGAVMAFVVAQVALNVAMAANPIGLVIIGLVALAAVFVVLWKKSDTFRRIMTAAFQAVLRAGQAAWSWIKANWPLLLAIITGPIGVAVAVVVRNWSTISSAASACVNAIKSVFGGLASFFGGIVSSIASAFSRVYNAIVDPFRRAYDWIKSHVPKISLPHIPGTSIGGNAAPTRASGLAAPAPAPASAGLAARSSRAGRAGAQTVTFNVNVRTDPLVSPTQAGATVVDALKAYVRANGRLPVGVTG